jgi:hypothetical protein
MSDLKEKSLTGEQSKRYGKARDNYDRLIADADYRKEQKETRTVTQIKKIRAGLDQRLTESAEEDEKADKKSKK